jgi:DNA-binding Xre family transcriptional regulator
MNIKIDILSLKHRIEIMQGRLHFNSHIASGAGIRPATVSHFVRGDITRIHLPVLTRFARYFEQQNLDIEVGDFFSWTDNRELVSNIGPLIQKLTPIPTDSEIADATGIPLLRLENLIRGNVKRVYLDDLARLLIFLEERGGSVEVGDLLRVEDSN